MRNAARSAATIAACALLVALLTACTSGSGPAPAPSRSAGPSPSPTSSSADPFGPRSFWSSSLAGAPVDPDSRAKIDYLVDSITDRYGGIAVFIFDK